MRTEHETKPTFADLVIRELWRPKTYIQHHTNRTMADLRNSIASATKYVLDDRMSGFLADLSTVPFMAAKIRRDEVLDHIRHGAMLPYPTMWVEYNGRAFRKRLLELMPETRDPWGQVAENDLEKIIPSWGMLLEQHPTIPTVATMSAFIAGENDDPLNLPFTYVWNCKDAPLPWNDCDIAAGMVAHGISGYRCQSIGVRYTADIPERLKLDVYVKREATGNNELIAKTHMLVGEMAGDVRYMMALLATLTDTPVLKVDVRPQKGFFARGQHRKYMDHSVIKLNVPQKRNLRLLAQRVYLRAKMRRHEVEGHWRKYQRGSGVLCHASEHLWGSLDEDNKHARCKNCTAWRTWIPKHERGSGELGYVHHVKYAVTHD